MELPRSRRSSHSPVRGMTECGPPYTSAVNEKKSSFKTPLLLSFVIIFVVVASWLSYDIFVSFVSDTQLAQSAVVLVGVDANISSASRIAAGGDVLPGKTSTEAGKIEDRTLGGLLPDLAEFEPGVCASRSQQPHRKNYFQPSKELIRRLRRYEVRHRKCAGRARNFFHPQSQSEKDDCRYVVWIAFSGLGNRLMTLMGAFLYALLTDRTLLVDGTKDMSELFCEPIPKSSWLLPPEFTEEWLKTVNESSPQRFAHNSTDGGGSSVTADFSYIHFTYTFDHKDETFFCDESQDQLESVPWVFMKSDNYLVPGYYFVSRFNSDLGALFPDRGLMFHLLGNYLFHPSDAAWAWITRFYRSYLSNQDRLLGIQIRTFRPGPLPSFSEQLQQCILNNSILPKVVADGHSELKQQISGLRELKNGTTVLMTSLESYYYDNLREYYLSRPTESGESVAIHQPSHEGKQRTDNIGHDIKAWAEIYLLSLSDSLITSGWSTFGYAAQALAGVRPWILLKSEDDQVPDPPCVRAKSVEPCYHQFPIGNFKCPSKDAAHDRNSFAYLQPCEDVFFGAKLVQ
ncbi:hypothetical protein R1flu_010622 [Riccia fluitans]|uniref:Fucosyltransferase n=1 Tax=Riccia fluitans TaxID=41844 RepID=A0ABD1Z5I0_9MARC